MIVSAKSPNVGDDFDNVVAHFMAYIVDDDEGTAKGKE